MEQESNIRIDGLIDDSSIRFPFSKTEQGLLQFPENQLFCCDSRLAVLVSDPGVKVTVLRRWDVDEKCTIATGQETCSTKSTEESSKTVINTTTMKSAQREAGERKAEDAGEREAEEGDKFSATTKKTTNVNSEIVSSTPNLSSAQSQSSKTTTKDDNRTGNGSKSKTKEQVENSDQPEAPMSSKTSGVSTSFQSYDENITQSSSTKTAETSKTGKSGKLDASKPTGSSGTTTSKTKGPIETTEETSNSMTTKPTGPSGMTTEETSESLDTSTAKPTGPSGMTTSKTSAQMGPSRVTTSKTSQSLSSTEKTTKKTHEQSFVDNEDTMEKALGSFVIYSRSVNFMTSCADDVLAMLEDDRINLRSERDAFRAVNEWILYDPVNRKQHAAKIMSGVRFSLMTLPELLRVVHASRYLFTVPEYRDQLLEAFIWRGACHCGYNEHFLDFEPKWRGEPFGNGCQCQCHVPNSSEGAAGAEGCCCAGHCQAPDHISTDTITYNREAEFRSRSL